MSEYETKRRSRILGLGIDQAIHGMKNIITYADPKHWPGEKFDLCDTVVAQSKHIHDLLKILESSMLLLCDMYQPAITRIVPNDKDE